MSDAQNTQIATAGPSIGALADLLHQVLGRMDALDAKVDTLGARLDGAQSTLDMLDAFRRNGPVVADFAATMATRAYDTVAESADPIALADAAIPLLGKAATEQNVALAGRLLDHADHLAMLLDKVDALEAALEARGSSIDALATRAVELTAKAAPLLSAAEVTALVEVEPNAVGLLHTATRALADTRAEPAASAGLFDLLRAPFDADISHFLGFGLAFARRMGKALRG